MSSDLVDGAARRRPGASFGRLLLAIAVVGLAGRVIYVEVFSSHIHFGLDAIWYELVAATVAAGKGYIDPAKFYQSAIAVPTAFRPPLYPIFLAAITKMAGHTQRDFQLAGCVTGTTTIVLTGLLGRRLGGRAVGLGAAALAAVYPVFLAIDGSVMAETIYVPLATACLLAVYRAIDRPNLARWALAGGLAGAAVLARGDGVLLVGLLVLPAALFVPSARWPRRALIIGVSLLAAGAVVAPWLIRNQDRLGTPRLSTLDSATAIAGTNCAATYSGPDLGSWNFACTQRPDQASLSEVALSNELQHDGLRYLRDHAGRLPVVVGVRVLRLWGLYDPIGQARTEAVESRNYRWQVLSWAAYLPVAALAGYGLVLLRRRGAEIRPLVCVLLAVTATAALTYGQQRFRASAEPVLIVAATVAVVDLARRSRRKRHGRRPAPADHPAAPAAAVPPAAPAG